MAEHLLFFIFIYFIHNVQTQALLPPKLTVNPVVVTERDSVTLNCQAPSSVSVSQCYFYFRIRTGPTKPFSCLKRLTVTELLLMTNQSSPAEVKVSCFYTVKREELYPPSPHSDISSIHITLLPPKLTVNPVVVTERDSVTLNCQAPSSVSVSQCYFYFGIRTGPTKPFSCLTTLTVTELLLMTSQSSPAEVKVSCFYTVKHGELHPPSPQSGTSSISIQTFLPPKLTVNPVVVTERDSVTLNCQAPSSVSVSQCYFYFGIRTGPTKPFSCLTTLTVTELLLMTSQSSPAEVKVSCFYTVKHGELHPPSPQSGTSSISIQTLLPPKLTVNPVVVTERDSVTLNCQAPSSVSVSQCYFYFGIRTGPTKPFSCLTTLTVTELLLMTSQNSPAEVKVQCFYTVKRGELHPPSPHSSTSSVHITLLPPKLTVNPVVVTERDSVTLNCQAPSSVSASQCYFYFGIRTGPVEPFSCLTTLTVTELLLMTSQNSPAEVKVSCFYTVKHGELHPSSPQSGASSISIQTLLPPKLTVNPVVVTERDSVTMNCQAPSSVSVSQCYFYFGIRTGPTKPFSCLKTLTVTELLLMTSQNSPAEVKVSCFYTVKHGELHPSSQHSGTSSISIQTLLPPKLTVNPVVVTERDSVTLNCQAPSSVSMSQCYFYFGIRTGPAEPFSCLTTLTVTELLLMTSQNSPAEVEVSCFYTVKHGELHPSSPQSGASSISIQTLLPPKLTVNPVVVTERDSVTLNCQAPSSVSVSQCYFYFGIRTGPTKPFSCLTTLTVTELLLMTSQNSPAEVKVSCFYTVKHGELHPSSPHSGTSSISIQSDRESSRGPTQPALIWTTTDSVEEGSHVTWTQSTSNMTIGTSTSKLAVVIFGFGVTVGVILLGLALRGAAGRSHKSKQANVTGDYCMSKLDHGGLLPAGNDEANNVITSVSDADCSAGYEELTWQEPQSAAEDIHHVYSVPETPPPSALKNMVYCYVQPH